MLMGSEELEVVGFKMVSIAEMVKEVLGGRFEGKDRGCLQ